MGVLWHFPTTCVLISDMYVVQMIKDARLCASWSLVAFQVCAEGNRRSTTMASEGWALSQVYSQGSKGQYLYGAKDLRIETRFLPALGPDEVQVAIRSTTLCGSDLHYYSHFANGDILVREPLCLGHESSGEVTSLGANVSMTHPSLTIGDAVALEVGVPCGNCGNCQNRRYNICAGLRFRSSGSKFPHYQGTLQERINHPASWVYKLPPGLDYETGALLEPLSVAVQAVRRLPEPPRDNSDACLVLGAGAVGLLCSIAARVAGFSRVIMADINEDRLQFAQSNGYATAIYSIKPRKGATAEESLSTAKNTAEKITSTVWADGKVVGRLDATFECTGVEACIQASIYATKPGGAVILVGIGVPNHILPVSEMMKNEISLIPSWRYAHTYPRAIEIATASVTGEAISGIKLPDIRKLITHRFHGIASVDAAMKTAGKLKDDKGVALGYNLYLYNL
ncbi:alcohol dehydrogenase [Xylaria sp. FL1042]|nr:alcohol dehydrogenase [Xylaria sp. FL1042]